MLSLNFDVYNNVSLGDSGDMTINISGIVAGQLVSFPVTVPLTVVNNYYGTAILYIVGQGIVPFEARGVEKRFREASAP